ncbi:hypothetical protein [Candidatus Lokiarchaeum ossiferum]|uniref:hypothetical protein n=1 Tax=Candidatus Lokiarchaeum ossiferum TaxID=2951803 RepID=UPI00352F3B69
MTIFDDYSNLIFSLINECSNHPSSCETRFPSCLNCIQRETYTSPFCSGCPNIRDKIFANPDYAVIGDEYEKNPIKILFVGQAIYMDENTIADWEDQFPPFTTYEEFNQIQLRIKCQDKIFLDSCGIASILEDLGRKSSIYQIAFTNIIKCANLHGNGINARREIASMLNSCGDRIFQHEMKVLNPDIIIIFDKNLFNQMRSNEFAGVSTVQNSLSYLERIIPINYGDYSLWRLEDDRPNRTPRVFIHFYHPSHAQSNYHNSSYTRLEDRGSTHLVKNRNFTRNTPSYDLRINLLRQYINEISPN